MCDPRPCSSDAGQPLGAHDCSNGNAVDSQRSPSASTSFQQHGRTQIGPRTRMRLALVFLSATVILYMGLNNPARQGSLFSLRSGVVIEYSTLLSQDNAYLEALEANPGPVCKKGWKGRWVTYTADGRKAWKKAGGRAQVLGEGEEGDEAGWAVVVPGINTTVRPVPFLGTNADYDMYNYVSRLFHKLDFPVRRLAMAHGGCDSRIVTQVETLFDSPEGKGEVGVNATAANNTMAGEDVALAPPPAENSTTQGILQRLDVFYSPSALGCGAGWNALLHHMMEEDLPWALIANNDIYFPPGKLKEAAAYTWGLYDENPNRFCMAFFREGPYLNDKWSLYAISRHFLQHAGYFDENIYPAYYEDVEMGHRHGQLIKSGHCDGPSEMDLGFIHGEATDPQGEDYISGSIKARKKMAESDEEAVQKRAAELQAKVDRGVASSTRYMNYKWGCGNRDRKDFLIYDCKHRTPFGNESLPLSFWTLDPKRRECIETGKGIDEKWCWYDEEVVSGRTAAS